MENIIIIAILAVILGLAAGYVYKSRKSGQKCIGCPDSGACSGCCSGGKAACDCSCGCNAK